VRRERLDGVLIEIDIYSYLAPKKCFSRRRKSSSKTTSKHNDQILLHGVFWDRTTHVSELHYEGHSIPGFARDGCDSRAW
jgi:hypothetical protein